MPVNTAKDAPRRPVSCATLNDLRRELSALEQAHAKGTLRATGNWTPGQILTHLEAFIRYPYEGYPAALGTPPWIIRKILSMRKKRYLFKGLPAGVKIPGVPGGTVGAQDVPFEQGMARFRAAIDRLEASPPTSPNMIFGPLTREEWTALHLRHAELHLSFLHHA
jgi:hypothetical protein